MNIHPLVVHYPIAFLTIYAVFELVRFRKIFEQPYWFYVKKVLIIVGWAGSIAAALTGFIASDWATEGPRIFVLHKSFAMMTVALSTISAIFYINNRQSRVLVLIAVLILISITVTAGLGGAMTKGTQFDPFMGPIFKLLKVY